MQVNQSLRVHVESVVKSHSRPAAGDFGQRQRPSQTPHPGGLRLVSCSAIKAKLNIILLRILFL